MPARYCGEVLVKNAWSSAWGQRGRHRAAVSAPGRSRILAPASMPRLCDLDPVTGPGFKLPGPAPATTNASP
jgi:hypothetical protein